MLRAPDMRHGASVPGGLTVAAALALCLHLGACGGREAATAQGGGGGSASGGARDDAGTGALDATAPGWSEVLGVYPHCAYSHLGIADGDGGTIALTQSPGGTLTVAYAQASDAGALFTLHFTPTTGTSAALAPPGQLMPWSEFCFAGGVTANDSGFPPDPVPTPVTLSLTSGALTYDAETLFVSFVGTALLDADATCGGGGGGGAQGAGSVTCSKE